MVLGDTHGNAEWLSRYVFPTARALDVTAIVQVGDYGFWEHLPAGVLFNDEVEKLASKSGIDFYWLRGNHDKSSLALEKYGDRRDEDGFVFIRDHVKFIPDGLLWVWKGRTFRAFGGAYSVDKNWRIDQEKAMYERDVRKEEYRASASNRQPKRIEPHTGSLWFPEEEMSDEDMSRYLAEDSSQIDFIFSHDKPRGSSPGWNRKDLLFCLPNQDRLQRALVAHNPRYWFHGHLHHFYRQQLDYGRPRPTTVVGLDPDDDAGEPGWRQEHTWALIDLGADGAERVRVGSEVAWMLDEEEDKIMSSMMVPAAVA